MTLTRRHALIVLGATTLVLSIVLYAIDPSMAVPGTPMIIDFEVAATRAHAARILAEWGPKGRDAARLSLWLDYAYLLSYGAFFTLAGLATRDHARGRGWARLARLGTVLPFLAVAAAVFDAAEDVALLLIVGGHGGSFGPPFATVCASLKFTSLALAVIYVLWGLARRASSLRDTTSKVG